MEKRIITRMIKPVFSDKRGLIADIFEGEIGHIGYVTFVKGAIRGSHYHKKSTQYTYVISGEIELFLKKIKTDNKARKIILKKGQFTAIPPGFIHTYKAITPSMMLDMTTLSREGHGYENDTVRVDSIKF